VRIQIIHDPHDFFVGTVPIGPILQHIREILSGPSIRPFDRPPALQGGGHHEPVGGSIAHIREVMRPRMTGTGGTRNTEFLRLRPGGFIKTDQDLIRIKGPAVGLQPILQGTDTRRILFRWNAPAGTQLSKPNGLRTFFLTPCGPSRVRSPPQPSLILNSDPTVRPQLPRPLRLSLG